MNKFKVNVPSNLKYISDWEGYQIPTGKCVIDKKVCGCGYTEFCLNNLDNIILCSPRLSLLENKLAQNPHCYYFQSISINKREAKRLGLLTEADIAEYIRQRQNQGVFDYLEECRVHNRPIKLLVTYDSLPKLLEMLNFLQVNLSCFKTVVDEFQLIFSDSKFKADIELDFITYLNHYCPNVSFLSSTPMLDEYLDQISEFKDLVYYEFCWESSRVILPNITWIKSENLEQSMMELINIYREGKGPTKEVDGILYQSREAVFYVSNVSMITSLIKKMGLKSSEVNIITSKTPENRKKIKKCGKDFDFGNIPVKGEPCKMFTFCTSTAFCGVDMYSLTAKSYVFSDCNLDTMTVDISLELPQIVGRQRLSDNKFRYDIVFYYQSNIREFSESDFQERIKLKNLQTTKKINNFKIIASSSGDVDSQRQLIRDGIELHQYSKDFCGIDKMTGDPIYNSLVFLSEKRAWELQNKIYNNDSSVLRVLEEVGVTSNQVNFLDEIVSIPYFELRMEKLIEHIKTHPEDIVRLPEKYKVYFDNIPIDTLSNGCPRKDALDKKLNGVLSNQSKSDPEIVNLVYSTFQVNSVYTKKELKITLSQLYDQFGLKAKAIDILNYFEVSRVQIKNRLSGKYDEGYRLLSKKL